jgi:phosphoglycolate phosphatase-like HAD superfamily hydrolase
MTAQKIIFLDFDGVLADTQQALLDFGGQAAARLGYPCNPVPADLDVIVPMDMPTFGRRIGIPAEKANEFAAILQGYFLQQEEPPALFAGMGEALRLLSQANTLGIITGNSAALVSAFLQRNGLEGCIRFIVGSDVPGTRARKIRHVLADLGAVNDSAWMVGDSVSDIRAAKEAGIHSAAVSWGHQSVGRLLAEAPDVLVHSPAELAGSLSEMV